MKPYRNARTGRMLKAKNIAKKLFEGNKHEPEWESRSYS